MYKLLLCGLMLLAFVPNVAMGENPYSQEVMQKRNIAVETYVRANNKWNWAEIKKSGGLIHPNTEYKNAVDFLYLQDPKTRPFIKFLSTYAVPQNLRNQTVLTGSFVLHSNVAWSNRQQPTYRPLALQQDDRFVPHQLVPGSSTLYWIDIRDFGWDNDAWEKLVLNDGYFVVPIVDERLAFLLTAEGLSPNILVRMDWLVYHAFNPQVDIDRGLPSISDILIYAQLDRPPANLDELKALWAIDNEIIYTTLVTKSQAVSRHNRVLAVEQGRFGRFYETFDVLFQEGARDYLEDVFNFDKGKPRVRDAGETFWDNQLGFLVYDLFNQDEKRVTFGDPTAVRHGGDILGDVRVRLSHSCTDCHSAGPLKAENTLVNLLAAGIKIRVPSFNDKAELESSVLGNGFEYEIEGGQSTYARAIRRVNGLSPEQNGANYLAVVAWYGQPVTIQQAAAEVGVMPDYLQAKLAGKSSGRLAMMIQGDEPMPRDLWESVGFDGIPGGFQQAMVLVYGLFFKDVQLNVQGVQFLQHDKYNWKDEFDIRVRLDGLLKKNFVEKDFVEKRNLNIEDHSGYVQKTQKIKTLVAKLEPKFLAACWTAGQYETETPKLLLRGPGTWPVWDNKHANWVGITVGGQQYYVQRTLITVTEE